jgi:hypothetical protein
VPSCACAMRCAALRSAPCWTPAGGTAHAHPAEGRQRQLPPPQAPLPPLPPTVSLLKGSSGTSRMSLHTSIVASTSCSSAKCASTSHLCHSVADWSKISCSASPGALCSMMLTDWAPKLRARAWAWALRRRLRGARPGCTSAAGCWAGGAGLPAAAT